MHSKTTEKHSEKGRKKKLWKTFLQHCVAEGGISCNLAVRTSLNIVKASVEEGPGSFRWNRRKGQWEFADFVDEELEETQTS